MKTAYRLVHAVVLHTVRSFHQRDLSPGPYSEGRLRGLKPPPEKSTQKFLGLPFCGNVEHVQPKNVAVTQYQQATQDVHCLLIWKLTGNLLSKLGTEDRTSVTYCQ